MFCSTFIVKRSERPKRRLASFTAACSQTFGAHSTVEFLENGFLWCVLL